MFVCVSVFAREKERQREREGATERGLNEKEKGKLSIFERLFEARRDQIRKTNLFFWTGNKYLSEFKSYFCFSLKLRNLH